MSVVPDGTVTELELAADEPAWVTGGTPPPEGACAEPRTSVPVLADDVQLADVFSGGAGEVFSPFR
jgi:hypothetical protein